MDLHQSKNEAKRKGKKRKRDRESQLIMPVRDIFNLEPASHDLWIAHFSQKRRTLMGR